MSPVMNNDFDDFALPEPPVMAPGGDATFDQAGILQIDEERAIRALPSLISGEEERARVLDAIQRIAGAQGALSANAQARLAKVQKVLGFDSLGAAKPAAKAASSRNG